eukprot:m.194842 g.194842  ORF g.194842 m.194842 type:complete len:2019 (+) comp18304_c1_seq1:82-6138(+)
MAEASRHASGAGRSSHAMSTASAGSTATVTSGKGLRSFASKINKDESAAEARTAISRHMSSTTSSVAASGRTSSISTASAASTTVPDYLKPEASVTAGLLQFETKVDKLSDTIEQDPLAPMLRFPNDDWSVAVQARRHRVEKPVPYYNKERPEHIKRCAEEYTRDWSCLSRKFSSLTQKPRWDITHDASDLKPLEFEVDVPNNTDPQSSSSNLASSTSMQTKELIEEQLLLEADDLKHDMLKYSKDTDRQHHIARGKRRISVLKADEVRVAEVPLNPLDDSIEPPSEAFGQRFLVNLCEFRMKLGHVEPLFCSMALYDVQQKCRVSENFYFDLNTSDTVDMLDDPAMSEDLKHRALGALFSVSHGIVSDLCIVIRVEKVLEGDITKAADTYAKEEKAADKARTNARSFCARLGKYRMPFVWCAIRLEDALMATQRGPVDLELHQQLGDKLKDEDLFRCLSDLKDRRAQLKKARKVPGFLSLEVTRFKESDQQPCIYTTAFQKVIPWEPAKAASPTLEIQEFSASPSFAPHLAYRHHLFVYPQSLNASTTQHRNIACRVEFLSKEGLHTADTQGLPCIYSHASRPRMVKQATTAVAYHHKTPDFYEEVKVLLPENLDESHHLLFSFFHVSCKEGPPVPAKLFGYAWFPLIKADKIQTGEVELPVAADLPAGYHKNREELLRNAKWLDAKNSLFKVKIKLDSTIASDDLYLQTFLSLCKGNVLQATDEPESLAAGIRNLRRAEPQSIYKFLHVIVNQLFKILITAPKPSAKQSSLPYAGADLAVDAFETLTFIVGLVHTAKGEGHESSTGAFVPSADLQKYIKYVFRCPSAPGAERTVHTELAKHMLHTLLTYEAKPGKWLKDCHATCITHAWFFYNIIVKSMAQSLAAQSSTPPRANRFPLDFLGCLKKLVTLLVQSVVEDRVVPDSRAKELIHSTAFFLRDLLTFADRGHVMDIIHCMFRTLHEQPRVNIQISRRAIVGLRLDALRIICSHELFVPMCLPVHGSQPLSLDAQASPLSSEYLRDHFLAALLLQETVGALGRFRYRESRQRAVQILTDVLANIDQDPRYQGPEAKQRIASLFFPVIPTVLNWHTLFLDTTVEEEPPPSPSAVHAVNIQVDEAQASSSNMQPPPSPGLTRKKQAAVSLTKDEKRAVLLLLIHVLKQVEMELLRRWWKRLARRDLESLLSLLGQAIECFEYTGKTDVLRQCGLAAMRQTKDFLSGAYAAGGVGNAQKRLHHRRVVSTQDDGSLLRTPSAPEPGSGTPQQKSKFHTVGGPRTRFSMPEQAATRTTSTSERRRDEKMAEEMGHLVVKMRQNLSHETSLVLLDVVEVFMHDKRDELCSSGSSPNELMDLAFDVLIKMLRTNQGTQLLQHLFATLQGFVNKFPLVLFQGTTDYCAELCEQVLKYCSCHIQQTRSTASAFLYLLMRKNFQDKAPGLARPGFSRVKVQATIALSQIVDTKGHNTEYFLRRSLGTIICYAKNDRAIRQTSFPEGVRKLAVNLYQILRDTSQIKQYESDPLMFIDVQYRIAQGYRNSPDLRLQWLWNMAQKQIELNNSAEAAQCTIHAAALVAEYLNIVDPRPGMPTGCTSFQSISANVLEESAVSDDLSSPDEEGICDHKMFQVSGLVGLLRQSAELFRAAQMYETANEVYKLLLPLFESTRSFQKLSDTHEKLAASYKKIMQVTESGKRYLGTYFRVSFYGSRFDDAIRNQSFVYKRPGITQLSVICLELKEFYTSAFGEGVVELLQDSNQVNPESLAPNKAYIQVTFVEPYFQEHELERRKTYFEQHTDLKHFKFETPFTATGGAHGGIQDQQMRKTYLTVEKSFPYLKTRLRVVSSREETLLPLQVATESIENKVNDLRMILNSVPTNVKMLQLLLQGCVSVSVNEGPAEVANVFLGPSAKQYPPKQIKLLRRAFGRFIKTCQDALELNAECIETNQVEYHETMEASYFRLREFLVPLISTTSKRQSRQTMISRPTSTRSLTERQSVTSEDAVLSLAQEDDAAAFADAAEFENSDV